MPNIFKNAGSSKPKRQESQSTESGKLQETVPFGHATTKEEIDKMIANPASIKLKDINKILSRLKEMHGDIDRKLDLIYQRTGLDPKFIRDYLNNPNNFSSGQWEHLQKEKQALLGSLMGAIKIDETPEQKAQSEKQQTEKSSKGRRTKMVGTRKNWISMR